ncbi:hypothetical protein [Comamonas resistens]|uniref:hypothetical protein n=1 Tax=Comamonas resistens TaxID=3046670 RepID=UPI0039BCAE12
MTQADLKENDQAEAPALKPVGEFQHWEASHRMQFDGVSVNMYSMLEVGAPCDSAMAVVSVRAGGVGFGWQGALTPEQAVEMGQALIDTAAQVRNIRNLATAAVQGGAE